MSDVDLTGWVVVVAGNDAHLTAMARAVMSAGAVVGVVSSELDDDAVATVRFRADPVNPDAWWRIAMHIEQHLGPIDGVVADVAAHETVRGVFEADLHRRGRAPVIVLGPSDEPAAVLTGLTGTPPTTPFPPGSATPDQ